MQVGQQRNQESFARLFAHFAPLIKGFCLSNPSSSLPGEAADELVQEVMFKVWTKAPSYDASKAAASTWIFTVMRNCRIDMMRRNSRHLVNSADVEVDDIWDEELDHQPFVRLQQSPQRGADSKVLRHSAGRAETRSDTGVYARQVTQ